MNENVSDIQDEKVDASQSEASDVKTATDATKEDVSQVDTSQQENNDGCDPKKSNDSDARIEKLQQVVNDLQVQLDSMKNDVARAYADADNLKKRLNAEAANTLKYRAQGFASEILPVLDNLERALAQPVDEHTQAMHKGMEMIYNQLKNALSKEGVEEIDCLNKPFDPNHAQSLMSEKKEGVESNIVIEVLQKGYMLKDRLLRAALVKVSE